MKLLYFLLLAILPSVIFAQSNYHSGYVLKNNGDTLKGYIDYGEWGRSPKSIDLKISKEDPKSQRFYPYTIKGFSINGLETYISYTGMLTINKTGISEAISEVDTTRALDTVFLKQLTTGKYLTLYSQSDMTKKRYFIAEPNSLPVELKYYTYYNDNNQLVDKDIFKRQLSVYLNKYYFGNGKLSDDLSRTRYEESDMESFIDELNNNGAAVKKKSLTVFFAGLGVNSTTTEVYNVIGSGSTDHSTTIAPRISAGLEIFENPNVQRFVFRVELSLSYITPKFKYPADVSGQMVNAVYEFNQYTAALTPQLLINLYNSENFKFYIDAGVAFNHSAYSNDQFIGAPGTSTGIINEPFKLETFYSNFPLQAGVTINKKIELFINHTGYAAYTKYIGFYASNQTNSAGIKYLFGKTK